MCKITWCQKNVYNDKYDWIGRERVKLDEGQEDEWKVILRNR